jgi:hypothetical protein
MLSVIPSADGDTDDEERVLMLVVHLDNLYDKVVFLL